MRGMARDEFQFSAAVYSVKVDRLAPHCNPVPGVIMGLRGPVTVISAHERVSGDILFIHPGTEHRVIARGGINIIYLDGLPYADTGPFARRMEAHDERIAVDAVRQTSDAARELRCRLTARVAHHPRQLGAVIADLASDPMSRMTQFELADRLKMERTGALRLFKAATGQTFRRFKQWSALQHAARQIAAGELVRSAAMDAGFADTAHLSRTFRMNFGLSPTQAIAGQAQAAAA